MFSPFLPKISYRVFNDTDPNRVFTDSNPSRVFTGTAMRLLSWKTISGAAGPFLIRGQ